MKFETESEVKKEAESDDTVNKVKEEQEEEMQLKTKKEYQVPTLIPKQERGEKQIMEAENTNIKREEEVKQETNSEDFIGIESADCEAEVKQETRYEDNNAVVKTEVKQEIESEDNTWEIEEYSLFSMSMNVTCLKMKFQDH